MIYASSYIYYRYLLIFLFNRVLLLPMAINNFENVVALSWRLYLYYTVCHPHRDDLDVTIKK